jgi:hypothetical protein
MLRRVQQMHRLVYIWGGLGALRAYRTAAARDDQDVIDAIEQAVMVGVPPSTVSGLYERYEEPLPLPPLQVVPLPGPGRRGLGGNDAS